MTNPTVPQDGASVNAETPQERLDRALKDMPFYRSLLTARKERLAARQHSFDVVNANLIHLVEDTQKALDTCERIAVFLAGWGQTEGTLTGDDEQDDADDNFHGRQMDARIESERRQDAQVSRAERDYLAGRTWEG